MLKNILKLSFTNFKEVWKLLLYRFVYFLFVLGLTTVASYNIIVTLIKENFFVNLQATFKELAFNLDFSKIFDAINLTFKDFSNIVSTNQLVAQSIICLVCVILVVSFFEILSRVSLHNNANGYMNSMVQFGFANSYVSNFGKSVLYWLVYIITELPITIAIFAGTYFFASKLSSPLGFWAVLLAVIILIVCFAIKKMIFGGWIPSLIINGKRVFRSFIYGLKANFKNFVKVFLIYLFFESLGVLLSIFSLTFTFGIGLFVVMPLWTIEEILVSQVAYYEAYGMRYYVDSDEIITPKRLEQQDKFAKVKDII